MFSQPIRFIAAAVLASVFAAGCGSKNEPMVVVDNSASVPDPTGGTAGQDGALQAQGGAWAGQSSNSLSVAPNGDAGSSSDDAVAAAGAYALTLPPGFTAANMFGGYRLGDPITAGDDGSAGSADSDTSGKSCGTTILAVIRDFKADNLNFEGPNIGDDRGIVQPTLGADRKPVFAPSGPTSTVKDPAQFDSWYRNVDGLNLPFKFELWFGPNGDVKSFQSTAFFPLDGAGFGNDANGNDGMPHNFHFTTEIHTQFKYGGGETFNFVGDDDVWVFINDQLAIDLGGVHPAETAFIDIDAHAKELGLVVGKVYPFDMFQNERHTTESNFRADTTLNFVDCGTIVPEVPK